MEFEIDLTTRIVVSAIIAGVISWKMYRPGMNKEQQDQFATQYFIIAVGIFVFFKPATVIIGIGAALLSFLHFGPMLMKQTGIAVANFHQEYGQFKAGLTGLPMPEREQEYLESIDDDVDEETLEELRDWARERNNGS